MITGKGRRCWQETKYEGVWIVVYYRENAWTFNCFFMGITDLFQFWDGWKSCYKLYCAKTIQETVLSILCTIFVTGGNNSTNIKNIGKGNGADSRFFSTYQSDPATDIGIACAIVLYHWSNMYMGFTINRSFHCHLYRHLCSGGFVAWNQDFFWWFL